MTVWSHRGICLYSHCEEEEFVYMTVRSHRGIRLYSHCEEEELSI